MYHNLELIVKIQMKHNFDEKERIRKEFSDSIYDIPKKKFCIQLGTCKVVVYISIGLVYIRPA